MHVYNVMYIDEEIRFNFFWKILQIIHNQCLSV